MAIRNSNEVRVWINGVEAPLVTDAKLTIDTPTVEVTSKPTEGYRERIPNHKTATVNFASYLDQLSQYSVGDVVEVRYGTRLNAVANTEGIITNISISGGTDTAPIYDVTIESDGETQQFIPIFTPDEWCTPDGRVVCDSNGNPICFQVLQ